MQHMRNSAIILAALLTATPTLATDQCVEVEIKHMAVGEPTYAKYADTAHCFLQIDGKIIIDRMCNISITQNLREWSMDEVAEVKMNRGLPDRPYYATFRKNDKWFDYGRVKPAPNNRQERICLLNKRFRMCVSQPYLNCAPASE